MLFHSVYRIKIRRQMFARVASKPASIIDDSFEAPALSGSSMVCRPEVGTTRNDPSESWP
jgi:hypothetical protein